MSRRVLALFLLMPLDNRTCFTVNLRDELRCRRCGAAPTSRETYHRGFEYHHVVHRSCGGEDVAENVILLCHNCHTALHRKRAELDEIGDITPPQTFLCNSCEAELLVEKVTMNCGCYLCNYCNRKTHLFDHFHLSEDNASTREET